MQEEELISLKIQKKERKKEGGMRLAWNINGRLIMATTSRIKISKEIRVVDKKR